MARYFIEHKDCGARREVTDVLPARLARIIGVLTHDINGSRRCPACGVDARLHRFIVVRQEDDGVTEVPLRGE